MRDTMRPLRLGIHAAINGQITYSGNVVKCYDEKVFTGDAPELYILYSTQQETPGTDQNDCNFIIDSIIDIEIIKKSGSEVSKDIIDEVSDQIYQILIPSPGVAGFTVSGFQVMNPSRLSAITRNISITGTESILQKTVRLKFTILEQN